MRKGLSLGAWIPRPVILPAALLGPRFVGPSAVLADVQDVGYAVLSRGVTGILLADTAIGPGAVATTGTQEITVDGAYTAGDVLTAVGVVGKAGAVTGDAPGLVRILEDSAVDGDIVRCEVVAQLPFAGAGASGTLTRRSGEVTPTSASHTVVTGLGLVTWAKATLKSAPTLTHAWSQADKGDQAGAPAAGSILIKSQKPTAAGDVTPIDATAPWGVVAWEAEGTL